MRNVRTATSAVLGRLASRLVRPRRRQVCFASIPDFSDSAFAVYRHLITTRHDLDVVWLVRDAAAGDSIRDHFGRVDGGRGNTLTVRRWGRPGGYLAFLRSAFVFHTHGVYSFSRPVHGRTVVSLWHGMPLKAIGALDAEGPWRGDVWGDVHIASSRFFRCVVAAAFQISPRSVLTAGLPRCDVLKGCAPMDHDQDVVRDAAGVSSGRALLLWLPTHRVDSTDGDGRGSFLDDVDPALLDALLRECAIRGCHLVVKLHPYDRLDPTRAAQLAHHPSVTLLDATQWSRTGVQLYDLLAASDGLITDVSSVLVDYLHTRRPAAVLGLDEESYERDLVVPRAVLVASAGVTALDQVADVGSFVHAVADRGRVELPGGDLAELLNEDGEICSSEQIAGHVGI